MQGIEHSSYLIPHGLVMVLPAVWRMSAMSMSWGEYSMNVSKCAGYHEGRAGAQQRSPAHNEAGPYHELC